MIYFLIALQVNLVIMRIAIDVVGVILDNLETFIKMYNEAFNTNHKKGDIKHWDYYKELNLSTDEFFELIHKTFDFPRNIPFIDEDAPRYMKELNRAHDLCILSALSAEHKNSLIKCLEFYNIKEGIHYKKALIVPERPYAVKLDLDFEIYVDDNPHLVEPIKMLEGTHLLLFDQPWNRDVICEKNVFRVFNWKEIFDHIQGICKNRPRE